jgi:anaerobic selenocysteine-containing dehydrogenase
VQAGRRPPADEDVLVVHLAQSLEDDHPADIRQAEGLAEDPGAAARRERLLQRVEVRVDVLPPNAQRPHQGRQRVQTAHVDGAAAGEAGGRRDRTMGVWERPAPEFLDALGRAFAFAPLRAHGLDSQKSVKAMHDRRGKVFISLGGNFLMALPDTAYTAEALSRTNLTVRIGTKLNRSDLVTGRQALILPCLGRTERDVAPPTAARPAMHQFVSCENSMGVIEWSRGRFRTGLAQPDG